MIELHISLAEYWAMMDDAWEEEITYNTMSGMNRDDDELCYRAENTVCDRMVALFFAMGADVLSCAGNRMNPHA